MYAFRDYDMPISFSTPHGDLEEIPATFNIEIDRYMAEPTSWGSSRGEDIEVTTKLRWIHLTDKLLIPRDLMVLWIGDYGVEKIEARVADAYYELVKAEEV